MAWPAICILAFGLTCALHPANTWTAGNKRETAVYAMPATFQALLSFGYGHALSVLHWFSLISHFTPDRDRPHRMADIGRKLNLVTLLNPKADHAYLMAATILPWGTRSTALSRPILDRAIQAMPRDWRWPFYKGFNAWWFDRRHREAARLLRRAAALPGAPPIVASLAARMAAEAGELDTALRFLESLLAQKQDVRVRRQIEQRIKDIRTERLIRNIERRLIAAHVHLTRLTDLERAGIHLPVRLPDGGVLTIKQGRLVSNKSGKRFHLYRSPAHKSGGRRTL